MAQEVSAGAVSGRPACLPSPCPVLSRDLGLEGWAADQGGQPMRER